ncbi:GNAT family N-acetyltransferase [Prescottella sp. R16]|uniref:GNAT family N-acetyltransferase n=1 Tax=Prescottella sp. R16 TaxID=3064529 RepID=UPI00272DD229|nr:GNAT family N-acetyltransferase [Prescottella sp. R16]
MTDKPEARPTVQLSPEQLRYEIRVGDEPAGFTQFVDDGARRIFFHTEIDERFAGRGLASTLIRAALADTTTHGKRIVPLCPFVAGFVEKHDDFADFVDPVTPEAERTVREALR